MSKSPNQTPSNYSTRDITSTARSSEGQDTSIAPTTPSIETGFPQMALLPPPPHATQQPIAYRPHVSYVMYAPHSGSYPPSQPPPPHGSSQPPNFPSQPAPRQRTAIACQYCRRRKIRCHGFDSSPQGKCTNCVRFHQECMFLPVSTQGHAFVPAHTAYPLLRSSRGIQVGPDGRPASYPGQQGPLLYNHQGQPLAPAAQHEGNYSNPQAPAGPGSYGSGQYQQQQPPLNLLPPTQPHDYYEGRGGPPRDPRTTPGQHGGGIANEYPDPNAMAPTSPASASTPYQNGPYPQSASTSHPYYQNPPGPTRVSPTTSYFPPRMVVPPHGVGGSNVLPPLPPPDIHPPMAHPSGYDNGRNTSPNTNTPRTGGLSVPDMLTPNGSTRSSADNDMVNALNRRRR